MSCRTVLPEKPPGPQLLIQFPVFYTTRQFITISTAASLTPSHLNSLAHPPTFCSHIYSSLNIVITAHMFSALQMQCWHTKMWDKKKWDSERSSNPLSNAPISNWKKQLTAQTSTSLSYNTYIKYEQWNKKTWLTITNTTCNLRRLYWTGTTTTLT